MGVFFILSFSSVLLFLGMNRGIMGQEVLVPHSRPYMAAIMRRNVLICGGSLIRKNWVLTAAHCPLRIGDKVILGAHSLARYEEGKQVFQVAKIIPHRNFNLQTFDHDIMLLKLDGIVKIGATVKTILLPITDEDVKEGTLCQIAGWGVTREGTTSDVLLEITVTILNRQDCTRYYGLDLITSNKLCAGLRNQNGGHCYGDSGGPLICGGIQRGIISFHPGSNCAEPNVPDGYTRLSKEHIEWIKNNLQG